MPYFYVLHGTYLRNHSLKILAKFNAVLPQPPTSKSLSNSLSLYTSFHHQSVYIIHHASHHSIIM